MSSAFSRHKQALVLKVGLLEETKYWKHSCEMCIKEITCGVTSLREAQDRTKRQIHLARAQLEERIKELELLAEKRLSTIVTHEIDSLQSMCRIIEQKRKSLQATESALNGNHAGIKLQRYIAECKQLVLSTRESLFEFRKRDNVFDVEFSLSPELVSVIDSVHSLGALTFVPFKDGNNITRTKGLNEEKTKHSPQNSDGTQAACHFTGLSEENRRFETENTENSRRFSKRPDNLISVDHALQLEQKYEHFFKQKKRIPPENAPVRNLSVANNAKLSSLEQARTQSAIEKSRVNNKADKIQIRISKSAREDNRHNFTGDGDFNFGISEERLYSPLEEQGPQSMGSKVKENVHTVRYHDYDFIKEITAVSDTDSIPNHKDDPLNSLKLLKQKIKPKSPSSLCSNSTVISSITYKPSSALASGLFNMSKPYDRTSSSHFHYVARFHTKKHPDETDLCRLTGIAVLESGHVVITDIIHLQIMLYGPDFHYLDALICPSPCGITAVDDTTTAVSLFHNRKLLLVKVHAIHLERGSEFHIQCQDSLFDVVYRLNAFYILCRSGDVHVLDKEGKQTSVVHLHCHVDEARHLDVEVNAQRIFVSGRERIICFNFEGNVLWQYRRRPRERRFTPGGLVLFNGRLFVTDWSTHKLIELSTEGTHVCDVISDNLENPQGVAIQHTGGKIFITQNNLFKQEARSRSIKVFALR